MSVVAWKEVARPVGKGVNCEDIDNKVGDDRGLRVTIHRDDVDRLSCKF